ncbi:MAG: TatD family hydrolase [Bacteriovoracaceae bacterium]|nr:TatD family hydrolase [Bacteriovoracaceae bacterium]
MDAHTHKHSLSPHVYILSVEELQQGTTHSKTYCAGVHPWCVDQVTVEQVEFMAKSGDCIGIGETGLDRLHPQWEKQLRLFEWHWDLAEKLNKPLILHLVRSSSDLLELLKKRKPKTPWLWHDFTGPIEALPSLLKKQPQMYFSCGSRAITRPGFNSLWERIPRALRLLETDDSNLSIEEIFKMAQVNPDDLRPNYAKIFPSINW